MRHIKWLVPAAVVGGLAWLAAVCLGLLTVSDPFVFLGVALLYTGFLVALAVILGLVLTWRALRALSRRMRPA